MGENKTCPLNLLRGIWKQISTYEKYLNRKEKTTSEKVSSCLGSWFFCKAIQGSSLGPSIALQK